MKKIDAVEHYYPDNVNAGRSEPPLVSIAFIIYQSMLMNMYILGRMTKPYNKNSVVIAGMNHINYVKDFLLKMGWEMDIESKKIAHKRVMIPNVLDSGSIADNESMTSPSLSKKKSRKKSIRL